MAGLSLHRENLSHKEPDGAIIELEHLLDSTFYPRNLPALDEASSDAVKATAPSPLADTMYHKHDYQERDRIEVKQDIIRASSKLYVPWVLRRMPLVGFAMAATSLIAVLEVLAHISAQHQGLGISNRKNHYLATYAPTAVFSLLAMFWNKVESHSKILMPWKLLSHKVCPADRSLLLDYVSANRVTGLYASLLSGDMPVALAIMGSFLIIIMTVLSTGLLISQPTLVTHHDISMSLQDRFDALNFNTSMVNTLPVLVAANILSGNLSLTYPLGTNQQYAVQSFSFSHHQSGESTRVPITASVEAFSADLLCETGQATNFSTLSSTGQSYLYADLSTALCNIGQVTIGDDSGQLNDTTESPEIAKAKAYNVAMMSMTQCQETTPTGNVNQMVIAVAQFSLPSNMTFPDSPFGSDTVTVPLRPENVNITVLFCTPTYKVESALVTLDDSGALLNLTTGALYPSNISTSAWSVAQAFETSLDASTEVFANFVDPLYAVYSEDSFFDTLQKIWPDISLGDWLNAEVLRDHSRRFFRASSAVLAKQYLTTPSTDVTEGSYQVDELRLVVRNITLRLLEMGLALTVLCALSMSYFRPTVPLQYDASIMGRLAAILVRSGRLMESLHQSGGQPLQSIGSQLSKRRYILESGVIEVLPCTDDDQTLLPSSMPRGLLESSTWWQPFILRKSLQILLIVLLLAVIIGLEVAYRMSRKAHGLGDVVSTGYQHYLWTLLPALILTVIKLMQQAAMFSIQILEPYRILKEGTGGARSTLFQHFFADNAAEILYIGTVDRRYALATAALATMAGPFLTIVVSGLFENQISAKATPFNVTMADYVDTSHCNVTYHLEYPDPAFLTAANLLISQSAPYPSGTYDNILYPNLALGINGSWLEDATELHNATSFVARLPGRKTDMTCTIVDPSDVRYYISPYGQGLNQLNFTFADLGSCTCENILGDFQCSPGLVPSLSKQLNPNDTAFEQLYYVPSELGEPNVWMSPETDWASSLSFSQPSRSCPDIVVLYGVPNDSTVIDYTLITCSYHMQSLDVDVTYSTPQQSVISVRANEGSTLPASDSCNPFGELYNGLDEYLGGTYNGNSGDISYWSLLEAIRDGRNLTTMMTHENALLMAERLELIYNTFTTQFLSTYNRVTIPLGATANGTIINANRERLVQSEMSTRILQSLLGIMLICMAMTFLCFDSDKLVTKCPCSIAAQASFLADSEWLGMVPLEAEGLSDRELLRSEAFHGLCFSIGWRMTDDGSRVFGIEATKSE